MKQTTGSRIEPGNETCVETSVHSGFTQEIWNEKENHPCRNR
jgi:hypothetical protein